MSRTTRTLPLWIKQQITSTNNLMNGYRGLQYGNSCYDYVPTQNGMVGNKKCWRSRRHDVVENEKTTIRYSTDNGQRSLRNCKHSLPIGKACGWNMCEATGQDAKKTVRRLWARANRRWSALVVREELSDIEDENPLHHPLHGGVDDSSDDYVDDDYYYDIEEDVYDPAMQYHKGYSEGFARGQAEGYMKAMAEFHSINRIA